MPPPGVEPGHITHPSTNRARRRVTSLIRPTQLPLCQRCQCMADVSDWLDGSRLRLNPGKTEVLWLGSKFCIDRITVRDISVLSVSIRVSDSARILWVVVDSRLSMADHVSSLCRSVYYQLRQLRPVVISDPSQKTLGDRSFSVAGPCLWNSLPVTLRDRDISLV